MGKKPNEADMSILRELALCEAGTGLLIPSRGPQNRAAKRLVGKGWADILGAAGLCVVRITDKGRALVRGAA